MKFEDEMRILDLEIRVARLSEMLIWSRAIEFILGLAIMVLAIK